MSPETKNALQLVTIVALIAFVCALLWVHEWKSLVCLMLGLSIGTWLESK